jgi:hypothetical protein
VAKTPKTPYTSVSDVEAFFSRVETIGEPKPPKKVDSSWVATYGFKTAHPSAIPSMLRWLGVINDEGESTGVWNDLRVDSTRQPTLERLVKEAYSGVFDAIDVGKADMRTLRGAFVSVYGLGDPARHIKCFLALCQQAEIPTAVETQARESKAATEPKPKTRTPKPPSPATGAKGDGKRTRMQETRGGSSAMPTGGLNITLNVEIPADWTEDQIRDRVAAVRRAAAGEDDK